MTSPETSWDDGVLPFQLDRCDVRGRVARLDGVLERILAQHRYPGVIEGLLAEAALLTAMMGQMIDLRWKLSLQVRGNGPVRIIATDYYAPAKANEPARMRAYASFDKERLADDSVPFAQIGQGYFAILMDQGKGSEPYQGVTALSGGSLAASAEAYFAHSEQLPTRFRLAAGRSHLPGRPPVWRAGGIMIQQMPKGSDPARKAGTDENRFENWQRANLLLDTVDDLELVGPRLGLPEVIYRLFHEEVPRVFPPQVIEFGCSCSAARVRESLSIYSAKDIGHMTTDAGIVTADCQFCGAHYEFDPETLGFEATKEPSGERR